MSNQTKIDIFKQPTFLVFLKLEEYETTFDTLDMKVFTNPSQGSPIMRTNSHIGETRRTCKKATHMVSSAQRDRRKPH